MLRIHRLGAYGSEATIIAASISALVGVRPAAFCARLNKTSRCRHAGSKANKPGLISGSRNIPAQETDCKAFGLGAAGFLKCKALPLG